LRLFERDRAGIRPPPAASTVDGRCGTVHLVGGTEPLPFRELGLALLPDREERRRDEDRRVRTRGHADDQREREVLERRAAAELEGDDRQQRDERRRQ